MINDFPLKNDIDLSTLTYEDVQVSDIPMFFCKNTFNTSVYTEVQTLQNIAETIKEPVIVEDKVDNEMWSFGEVKDQNEGHKDSNIKTKSKFFMVDYDNGYTIEQFEKDYKDYFYLLYTSFSHTKEHNKFRVIMYGNYDKPLIGDEQNLILSECFRNADRTTLQPNRMFYMPAHKKDAPYYFKLHHGKQFPLMNPVIRYLLTQIRADREKQARQRLELEKYNKTKNHDGMCKNYTTVKHYLETPYPKLKGNGDSNSSLFAALKTCMKYNDNETLQDVVYKARLEHWTTQEIDDKINRIKEKYL